MSSRERVISAKRPDEFNPIGESLAHNFLQNRNQYLESKSEYNHQNTNSLTYDRVAKNNSLSLHDRGDKDLWAAGGEHLSTNKLSMMLSDMQGRLKDLPTPDPSEDGLMWGRTPSTDSHDTSELDSVLFGGLRTEISDSPSYYNSRSMSPGVNLDHKRISLHGNYSRQHDDDNDSLSSVSTASTSSFQRSNRQSRLSKPTSYGYGMTAAAAVPVSRLRSSSGHLHRILDPESDYISDGASVTSLESAGGKSSQNRKLEINPVLSRLSHQQPEQHQPQQPLRELQNPENLALRGMMDPSAANEKAASLAVCATNTTPLNNNNMVIDKKNSTSPIPARSVTPTPSAALVSSSTQQSPTTAAATGNTKPRSTTPTNIPRAVNGNSNQNGQLSPVRNGSNVDQKVLESTALTADVRPSRARDITPNNRHRALSLEPSVDAVKKTPDPAVRRSSSVERDAINRNKGGLFIHEPPMSPLQLSKIATEALPLTPIQRNNAASRSTRPEPFHRMERPAAAGQHPSTRPSLGNNQQRLAIETPPPLTESLQLSRIATESLPLTPVQSDGRNNTASTAKSNAHISVAPSRSTTTVTTHTPPSTAAGNNGSGEKKTTSPQGVVQKVEINDDPYPTRGRMRIRNSTADHVARTSVGEKNVHVLNNSNNTGSGGNSTSEDNTAGSRKAVMRSEISSPAAIRQQERDRARSQSATRSRSVTRSDPSAATSTTTKRTSTPNGSRRALTDSSAVTTTIRSPPAVITPPPTKRGHQTPANTSKPLEQNSARKGRMSFGTNSNNTSSVPTTTRSRSRSPAGAATSRSPLLPSTTTRNNTRTMAAAPQVQQTRSQPRKFSLPGANTEQITTAQQAQQAQRGNNSRLRGGNVATKVNTTVVPVRSPNTSGPKRSLSASSLSTQGSSGKGSRISTPTSTSGTGSQNGRLSRPSSFKSASSVSGVPTTATATTAPTKDRSLTLVQLKSVNPYPLRSSSSPRHSLENSSNSYRASPKGTAAGSPGQKQQSPSSIPKRFFDDGQPSPVTRKPSYSRQSYPLGPERSPKLVVEVTSPTGDIGDDGYSPVALMHGKSHRLFQPPVDAVPYQSCTIPLRFMMPMIHLSQESISGVYDSANYNPSPVHFPRSPKSIAKYIMRGVDTQQLDKNRLDRDKFSREASRDDADQGSGRTETTRATMSSTDTFDQDDGSQG